MAPSNHRPSTDATIRPTATVRGAANAAANRKGAAAYHQIVLPLRPAFVVHRSRRASYSLNKFFSRRAGGHGNDGSQSALGDEIADDC
jgi:hypothetical protein